MIKLEWYHLKNKIIKLIKMKNQAKRFKSLRKE